MDVTPDQGAPSADSPAASTTTTEASESGFSEAGFEAANRGEKPPDAPESPAGEDVEQKAEPEGDQPPEGEESAEAEEKKADEDAGKSKTERRIEQLLQQRKEARQEAQRVKQEFAQREVRFKLALQKVLGDVETLKQKLSTYEDTETPEFKLRDMEAAQQARERLTKEEQQLQERFAKERLQAETEEAKAALFDAMDDALASFPHLTRPQLQARFREYAQQNPGVTFEQAPDVFRTLAAEIDEQLYEQYEARALKKHAPRLAAPEPVSSTKTVASPKSTMTDDEFAAHLESVFGADAFG